jgi:hypothetical protein
LGGELPWAERHYKHTSQNESENNPAFHSAPHQVSIAICWGLSPLETMGAANAGFLTDAMLAQSAEVGVN